jgi:YidC/Oxa1 family membrane protein insertase
MSENNNNFLIAMALSFIVLMGWMYFIGQPQMKAESARQAILAHQEKAKAAPQLAASRAAGAPANLGRIDALKLGGARVPIDTPTVDGSLLLKGAVFDDIRLKNYHETLNKKSPEIVLLAPKGTSFPYYAMFGWVSVPGAPIKLPDDSTNWKLVQGTKLAPGSPVVLAWDNGHGLLFTRTVSIDDQYMISVNDAVTNKSGASAVLYPYGFVARDGIPVTPHAWVLHEGFVGVADGTLKDANYDDFKDDKPPQTFHSTGGWVGFTDKYWMASVIPPQNESWDGVFHELPQGSVKAYQADYRLDAHAIAPGATVTVAHRLFAGAKVVQLLQHYEDKDGVARFHMAVDWGWFWFFTQPIFFLLDLFYRYIGNFGIAILLLTVTIKVLFFPLADASYRSMSKMKKLQPEMEKIKARFGEDKVKQQQETMELYRREKVNPVSGCLPTLIQIPIFFSLYKVLYVTIEMRQAPFFGWIHDLSAPDPTNFINLFGLLPWGVPAFMPTFLLIGIWPMLMGITQWLQTKMNPAPADPTTARMMSYMPIIFTAMMAGFPAGLVIYWTWNNLLSVGQQYVMMRRQGVEIHLFKGLKLPDFIHRWFGGGK